MVMMMGKWTARESHPDLNIVIWIAIIDFWLHCFFLQLTLKSKTTSPLTLYFLMLHGPFGEMQVLPKIYHFEFTETTCESPLVAFPLRDSAECNKVLSGKAINCRCAAPHS